MHSLVYEKNDRNHGFGRWKMELSFTLRQSSIAMENMNIHHLDDFPIQTSISTGFPSHVNFPSTTSGNVWVSRRGLVSDDEVNELRREADGEEPWGGKNGDSMIQWYLLLRINSD